MTNAPHVPPSLSPIPLPHATPTHVTRPPQRILAVNYELPSHVAMSLDCRDLLAGILVAEPARRLTVPQILQHPWFLRGLPEGVADMNNRLVPPHASEIRSFSMPDGVQV